MEQGRDQLLAGDAQAAAKSFREGEQLFARAEDRTDGPAFWVTGWLPIVGRTTDAVGAIASSTATAAAAAIDLADAAAEIPGGLSGLAPTDGRIPIERLQPLARAAEQADGRMTMAVSRLDEAPTSLLLGSVGTARRDAEEELDELADAIHAASLLLQGLTRVPRG